MHVIFYFICVFFLKKKMCDFLYAQHLNHLLMFVVFQTISQCFVYRGKVQYRFRKTWVYRGCVVFYTMLFIEKLRVLKGVGVVF